MTDIRHQLTSAEDSVVVVLTTWPADRDVLDLAIPLVDASLASCVSAAFEGLSVYRWKGKIEQERERQLLIKTTRSQLEALHARLRELHPYDVPEFLVLDVASGSGAYLDWVAGR